MADTKNPALVCSSMIPVKIPEDRAIELVKDWLEIPRIEISDPRVKNKLRFGKAVLVYYPFWKFYYEDGGVDKILFRPACGTLFTGLQDMQRENTPGETLTNDISVLPATVDSSVYLPELHGIHRSEELIAVPLWLISYKVKKSIYMVEVDGENGKVYEEWHPVKETVNWKKTALIIFIPMMVLSFLAVFFSPWIYILVVLLLFLFLYQSNMISMINLKRKEGKDGS